MAQRIPEDVYFGSGNQGRLRLYDPNASEFKGSPDLIDFAIRHGFYDPQKGPFDFAAATHATTTVTVFTTIRAFGRSRSSSIRL